MIIREVKIEERNRLENILQLYLHDLCNYFLLDFNSDKCIYEYDLDSYFVNNKGYFICENDNILGFILLDIIDNLNYELSEMFVLNNYKKKHIGSTAVTKLFDLYKGNWTIKAVPNSKVAEAFWINTVKKYTNDNFRLEYVGKYDRAELNFNNK